MLIVLLSLLALTSAQDPCDEVFVSSSSLCGVGFFGLRSVEFNITSGILTATGPENFTAAIDIPTFAGFQSSIIPLLPGDYTATVNFSIPSLSTDCSRTFNFTGSLVCVDCPSSLTTLMATTPSCGNSTPTLTNHLGVNASITDVFYFIAIGPTGTILLPTPTLPIPGGSSSSIGVALPSGNYTASLVVVTSGFGTNFICGVSTDFTVPTFSAVFVATSTINCTTGTATGLLLITGISDGTISVDGGVPIPVTDGLTVIPVTVNSTSSTFNVTSSTCGSVSVPASVESNCCSLAVQIFPRGTRCNRNDGQLKVFVGANPTHQFLFSLDGAPSRRGTSPFIFDHVSPYFHAVFVTDPATGCTQLTYSSIKNDFDCSCVNECSECSECNESSGCGCDS